MFVILAILVFIVILANLSDCRIYDLDFYLNKD